ncbi:hypothetical protein [Leeia oryzae]|uniref:hypothetical protein n=1 Tax=Leeia oryzae TaxID=356662 RepID=UPI00035CB25D|nr:hypothetical protein [Leeia oryzae]
MRIQLYHSTSNQPFMVAVRPGLDRSILAQEASIHLDELAYVYESHIRDISLPDCLRSTQAIESLCLNGYFCFLPQAKPLPQAQPKPEKALKTFGIAVQVNRRIGLKNPSGKPAALSLAG